MITTIAPGAEMPAPLAIGAATASTAAGPCHPVSARHPADRLAGLIAAGDPDATARARGQVDRAMRRVQLEVEELLDGTPS